jgi:hypothetical protein
MTTGTAMTDTIIDIGQRLQQAKLEGQRREKDARMLVSLAADIRAGRVTVLEVGGQEVDAETICLQMVLRGRPSPVV